MLTLEISTSEQWDYQKEEFVEIKGQTIVLEHSLVSISKWEAKWHKPFLSKTPKTREEEIDYIKCMTITPGVHPSIYSFLTESQIKQVNAYIEDPMTATTFSDTRQISGKKKYSEVITSEIIYYWMISLNIPVEFQKWHVNRLLTLIKVCNIKNAPPKKMSKSDIYKQNAAINAANRKRFHTKG